MNEDLYALLGVERGASEWAIRRAYRGLVKTAHPDRGGDPDEFVRITMAYNVLTDPEQRKAYDLAGEIVDENALQAQTRVIRHIASMFEQILEDLDVPPEQFDIISAMKSHVSALEDNFRREDSRLAKILSGLHKTNSLIKRKGEKRNIFSEIAEKRILEYSEEFKLVKMQLRDVRRVREELDRYESIVDVIRTVQAGAYTAQAGGGFFRFINLTTT